VAERGKRAKPAAEHSAGHEGYPAKQERLGNVIGDDRDGRTTIKQREAELAARKRQQVGAVLFEHRPVDAPARPVDCDHFVRRAVGQQQGDGIARSPQHDKDHGDDDEQRRGHAHDPEQDETQHMPLAVLPRLPMRPFGVMRMSLPGHIDVNRHVYTGRANLNRPSKH